MEPQVYYLASLSIVDQKHDELNEEFGDLPQKVTDLKRRLDEINALVSETQHILKDNKEFAGKSKITLLELKEKEEKLAKQQFKVRNNKEFDAITKEIEHSRSEYSRISEEVRVSAIKEENLKPILEEQKKDAEEVAKELKEQVAELNRITSDQNEEVKELMRVREEMLSHVDAANYEEYKRIRTFHSDAVVKVKKNSCSGCYNNVPPQKIVECRNNLDKLFTCEHCGRIIYPEEIIIDKYILNL